MMDDGPEDVFDVEMFGGLIIAVAIASYRTGVAELKRVLDDDEFAFSTARNVLSGAIMDIVNAAASNAMDQGEE